MFFGVDRDAFSLSDGVTFRHERQRDSVEGNLRRRLFELVLRGRRGLLLGALATSPATGLSLGWRSARRCGRACAALGVRRGTQ